MSNVKVNEPDDGLTITLNKEEAIGLIKLLNAGIDMGTLSELKLYQLQMQVSSLFQFDASAISKTKFKNIASLIGTDDLVKKAEAEKAEAIAEQKRAIQVNNELKSKIEMMMREKQRYEESRIRDIKEAERIGRDHAAYFFNGKQHSSW